MRPVPNDMSPGPSLPRYFAPPDPPLPPPGQEDLLHRLILAIERSHLAVEPFLPVVQNAAEVAVHVVRVVTPGVPVPAPEIPLVAGVLVVIRQRHHVLNRTGYVSYDGSMGAKNPLSRIELNDNDSIAERLTSLDEIYFDATAADTYFEIVFRQSRRVDSGSWASRPETPARTPRS